VKDAFSKVRPGEPLKIAAQAWNQVIDQVTTRPRFDAASAAAPPINFQVRCKNATTGDVPRWGVLQITGILETPTGATGTYATGPKEPGTISFLSYPGVVGVTPTSDAGAKFVVATQPIKAGEVGMAAIDGVVQVKLDVTASGDRFAGVKPGSVQQLRTGTSGDAAVLWKEGGTGVKWGLVRIGAGAGGGVKVGKITGTWTTGSDQTVYEYSGEGTQLSVPTGTSGATAPATFTGVNRFATVEASGSAAKWVAAAKVDSTWHLIAAECA